MLIRCTIGDLAQPATRVVDAGEYPAGRESCSLTLNLGGGRMLDMTDHIMKTLLNIMVALSLGAFMVLFIVL